MRWSFFFFAALGAAGAAALGGCSGKSSPPPVGAGGGGVDDGPTFPVEQLQDPETCKECHPNQYKEWSGSMHAYASDDPLFRAMNKQGQDQAKVGDFCVKCHAPMAVALNMTTDGLNLDTLPSKLHGVTCYFCHQVDDVRDTHNNPLHLANDATMRGEYRDAARNKAHHSEYSVLHDPDYLQAASVCGSCHDIVNTKGAHLERTYSEWQASLFSTSYGLTCNSCHMHSRPKELAAEGPDVEGVGLRTVHDHKSPGIDVALTTFPETDAQLTDLTEFLSTSLQAALCVSGIAGDVKLWSVVGNLGVGHQFPSGASQDRRSWVELTAYDASDNIIYQSGVVPPGTAPTALNDPDMWMFRDCMFDDQSHEVHTFWDAASVDPVAVPAPITLDRTDRRFYQSHIAREFPLSQPLTTYPAKATMRIWVQAFPLDVFDELFADPGQLGYTAGQVAAMRAKIAPMMVLEQNWTANDPANQFLASDPSSAPMPTFCASKLSLSGSASSVGLLPKHTNAACKP